LNEGALGNRGGGGGKRYVEKRAKIVESAQDMGTSGTFGKNDG